MYIMIFLFKQLRKLKCKNLMGLLIKHLHYLTCLLSELEE